MTKFLFNNVDNDTAKSSQINYDNNNTTWRIIDHKWKCFYEWLTSLGMCTSMGVYVGQ